MKVLVSDVMGEPGLEIFEAEPGIELDVKTGLSPEELKSVIGDYDALAIRSATKVTKEILDAATNLKVIARAGIGLDNVDIDHATKKGVAVMNTPGGNTVTTAEHAICHINDDGIDKEYSTGHTIFKRGQMGEKTSPGP